MELIPSDVERLHRSFAELDSLLVDSRVEDAFDLETGLCSGGRHELDDGGSIREWPAAPVLRDAAEQAMFNLIPLRRSPWIVAHLDGKPCLVCEFLQLQHPQPHPSAIRAAAVRRDRQFVRLGLARPACPS